MVSKTTGITLFFSALYSNLVSKMMCLPKLTALNDSCHTIQLYQDIANKNEPSEIVDRATTNALVRTRICEDIVRTGYFRDLLYFMPVQREIAHPVEPYTIRQMTVNVNGWCRFEDYCFKCYFERLSTNDRDVREFYVSKEYNVSPVPYYYKPGRFVVGRIVAAHLFFPTNNLILAEESAKVYAEPHFNVELHYLRIRKYIRRVKDREIEPVCSVVSEDAGSSRNQHRRLCVAVLTSSYFEETDPNAPYPRGRFHRCVRKKITFRTPEAHAKVARQSYYELMVQCPRSGHDSADEPVVFISRAYLSNQVFVLRRDPKDKKTYLMSLSTNVSFADELNSFDFVED